MTALQPPWWRDLASGLVRRHGPVVAATRRRWQQVLLLAGVTGIGTGLMVALFERVTAGVLLRQVLGLPLWAQALAPGLGLLGAFIALWFGRPTATTATSDAYIVAFHDPGHPLRPGPLPWRTAAAVSTLGLGAPLGYEGPSIYLGATFGAWLQRRFRVSFTDEDRRLLMVAGAAAGVAAVFKTPVTGLVFALEVPYQDDLARHMLLPAATSAAASYVTFALLAGTEPLLPVVGQPGFNVADLGGAALVGIAAGVLARLFVVVIRGAKQFATRTPPALRVATGAAVLAVAVLATQAVSGGSASLALGPGYRTLRWALEPSHGIGLIVLVATLRVLGTAAAVGGGGVGGLFIPLVIQGALLGRFVGGILPSDTSTLFPVVGMAAFLGAGYRTPLAAVVFVAEFTGRPGFVVPGLIAAVTAQLLMGDASVSPYQSPRRVPEVGGGTAPPPPA